MDIQKCDDINSQVFLFFLEDKPLFYSHTYLQSTIEKSNGRKVCRSALPCPCDLITLITRELE